MDLFLVYLLRVLNRVLERTMKLAQFEALIIPANCWRA